MAPLLEGSHSCQELSRIIPPSQRATSDALLKSLLHEGYVTVAPDEWHAARQFAYGEFDAEFKVEGFTDIARKIRQALGGQDEALSVAATRHIWVGDLWCDELPKAPADGWVLFDADGIWFCAVDRSQSNKSLVFCRDRIRARDCTEETSHPSPSEIAATCAVVAAGISAMSSESALQPRKSLTVAHFAFRRPLAEVFEYTWPEALGEVVASDQSGPARDASLPRQPRGTNELLGIVTLPRQTMSTFGDYFGAYSTTRLGPEQVTHTRWGVSLADAEDRAYLAAIAQAWSLVPRAPYCVVRGSGVASTQSEPQGMIERVFVGSSHLDIQNAAKAFAVARGAPRTPDAWRIDTANQLLGLAGESEPLRRELASLVRLAAEFGCTTFQSVAIPWLFAVGDNISDAVLLYPGHVVQQLHWWLQSHEMPVGTLPNLNDHCMGGVVKAPGASVSVEVQGSCDRLTGVYGKDAPFIGVVQFNSSVPE